MAVIFIYLALKHLFYPGRFMRKTNLLIILFILSLLFCSKKETQKINPLFLKSKTLEYTRNTDIDGWKNLLNRARNTKDKLYIIHSLSKIKDSGLIPLYKSRIPAERKDSILIDLVKAVGLIGNENAEELLLELPYADYSLDVRLAIVKALASCASEKTVTFLLPKLVEHELRPEIIQTLAIYAKNNFIGYETKQKIKNIYPALDNRSAYFMYNSRSYADVPYLVMHIDSTTSSLAQKYLLKALYSLYKEKPSFFVDIIKPDSLLLPIFRQSLYKQLSDSGTAWQNKYYALYLAGALLDSSAISVIKSFTTHSNPHLKLAAFRAYSKIDKEHSFLILMNEIAAIENNILKGQLIKLLAETKPEIAYRFVMENLDKGNKYFKGLLLDALAIIGNNYALKSLRQFIAVDNDYLRNRAFNALNSLKRIRKNEVKMLLNSSAVSSFSIALEWMNKHKQKEPLSFLIEKFKAFSFIEGFEAQRQILLSLKTFYPEISPDVFDSLYTYASIYQVKRDLIKQYPTLGETFNFHSVHFELPEYLQTDSLFSYSANPVVSLKTEKGALKIELFPRQAPLTVKNFLSLARKGFYNNLSFHRVVPDFVIQGGDPVGDGWGGPGYVIPSEDNLLSFKRGSVGMATSGYDTGGCQFFICQSEQFHLNGNYTLFGKVIENIEIIDSILQGDKILSIEMEKEHIH